MKTNKRKFLIFAFLGIVLAAALLAQVRIVGSPNYTLAEGETVSGMLFLLSQNVDLEEGSSVGGSVIMLCCNLTVDGRVDGDVFLLTGNLWVKPHAEIAGDVSVTSGNLSK